MITRAVVACLAFNLSAIAQGQVIITNLTTGSVTANPFSVDYGSGTYRMAGVTNQLVVPEGKQLLIHGMNQFHPLGEESIAFIRANIAGNFKREIAKSGMNQPYAVFWDGPILGPMTIEYGIDEESHFFTDAEGLSNLQNPEFPNRPRCEFILELIDSTLLRAESTAVSFPSTSVVIPSNATGDVDVLLEQSTDMITWTQCLPGTYNASTQKRFFRVRAVEK